MFSLLQKNYISIKPHICIYTEHIFREMLLWIFPDLFSYFFNGIWQIRHQHDLVNIYKIIMCSKIQIRSNNVHAYIYITSLNKVCVCVTWGGGATHACKHINLYFIHFFNQFYSAAHSHNHFELSFIKIRWFLRKIQNIWHHDILPIKKALLRGGHLEFFSNT